MEKQAVQTKNICGALSFSYWPEDCQHRQEEKKKETVRPNPVRGRCSNFPYTFVQSRNLLITLILVSIKSKREDNIKIFGIYLPLSNAFFLSKIKYFNRCYLSIPSRLQWWSHKGKVMCTYMCVCTYENLQHVWISSSSPISMHNFSLFPVCL